MISGAVFDADGTLLDSMWIWNDIGIRYLESLNILPEADFSEKLITMSLNQSVEYIKQHYGIKEDSDKMIKDISKLANDFYEYEVELKPGVVNTLNWLYQRDIPITVATSSDKSYIIKAFKRLDILKYLKKIYTCVDYNTNKSLPYIYMKASEDFRCTKKDIYIFEDAYHAAKTVHEAGFKLIGIFDESAKADTAKIKAISDIYINSFTELDMNLL